MVSQNNRRSQVRSRAKNALISAIHNISLEPNIVFYICASGILAGAAIQTNLKLWKICHVVMSYEEEMCKNLSHKNNTEIQDKVQVYLNNFDLYANFFGSVPGVIYSFFAGALSDRHGRKLLMLLPISGYLVANIFEIVHFAFIKELPMAFFYFDQMAAILGGTSLYYLGVYGYGADITTDDERATRYAIYDGVEMIAFMFGMFLSPKLYNWGGNQLNYSVSLALNVLAVSYIIIFVKETKRENYNTNKEPILKRYVFNPLKEFFITVTKKREGNLRAYIYILLAIYSIYWANDYGSEVYLYLRKVMEGFSGQDLAYLNLYQQWIGIFGLLVLLPFLSKFLHWHETSTSLLITLSVAFGLTARAFVKTLTGYYVASFFCSFSGCTYCVARSLFTKLVGRDEVGKIFSAVAFIAAIFPLISDPIYKKLYNATIATFPAAFFILAAALAFLNSSMWTFLWFNRQEMKEAEKKNQDENDGEQNEEEKLEAAVINCDKEMKAQA